MSLDSLQAFPDNNVQDRVRKMANRNMHRVQSRDLRTCVACHGKFNQHDMLLGGHKDKHYCRECYRRIINRHIPGQGC